MLCEHRFLSVNRPWCRCTNEFSLQMGGTEFELHRLCLPHNAFQLERVKTMSLPPSYLACEKQGSFCSKDTCFCTPTFKTNSAMQYSLVLWSGPVHIILHLGLSFYTCVYLSGARICACPSLLGGLPFFLCGC